MTSQSAKRTCSLCDAKYYSLNLCHYHYDKNWNTINREKRKEYERKNYAKRRETTAYVEYKKKYNQSETYIANKKIYDERYVARRTKQIALATPPWANLDEINQFMRNCPPGYAVDHIAPLLNKNLSGLHTLDNLRYITIEENRKKGNRIMPELICSEFYADKLK